MDTSKTPARAGSREWIGLAVIALPCLLYSMDLTVLNLAIPKISADLNPSGSQLLWIIDIYGFMVAGFLLTMGTLGDRIGRRKLLLIGAAAFGIASVVAAFADTTATLIAARALLGIAGATLAPSTLSLIRNMFHDPAQRTVAISVWAMSFSVGGAIGPVLGGLMLQHFWWGSVFLLAVPVMILLLIVGPFLLPEFKDSKAGRLDFISAAMSLVAVLSMIYGLKHAAETGFDMASLATLSSGLLVGVMFVRRQRRLEEPMIDLDLFRAPAFSAALATNLFSMFAAFASFLYIAQYLQMVLGFPPLVAGLWMLPSSAGFVAGSMVAPLLLRQLKPALAIAGALTVSAVGFGVLSLVTGSSGLLPLVIGSVILAVGLAPAITLTTDIIISSAPAERAGMASGMSETGAEFGGALGIAVLGSVGTAIYRGTMADSAPAGMPADAVEAASRTLGGALAATENLSEQAADVLREMARYAFAQSMQVTAIIAAVVLVATAVVVGFLLRHHGRGNASGPGHGTNEAPAIA